MNTLVAFTGSPRSCAAIPLLPSPPWLLLTPKAQADFRSSPHLRRRNRAPERRGRGSRMLRRESPGPGRGTGPSGRANGRHPGARIPAVDELRPHVLAGTCLTVQCTFRFGVRGDMIRRITIGSFRGPREEHCLHSIRLCRAGVSNHPSRVGGPEHKKGSPCGLP